jgi:hypothetical protein
MPHFSTFDKKGESRGRYTYLQKTDLPPQGFDSSLSWKITTGWASVVGRLQPLINDF